MGVGSGGVGDEEARRCVVGYVENQRIRTRASYDRLDREIVDRDVRVGLARRLAFDADDDDFADVVGEVVGKREGAIDDEALVGNDVVERDTAIVGQEDAHVASVEGKDIERECDGLSIDAN